MQFDPQDEMHERLDRLYVLLAVALSKVDEKTRATVVELLERPVAAFPLSDEALNALAKGEAVVVNTAEVTCEAETERDLLFNRLGRVTSELGLPVDATASRILGAIDEKVADEREACASLDVRVEVPADAETWTPLEAWEEALIALNEAWRDAVRKRAASSYAPPKGGGDE